MGKCPNRGLLPPEPRRVSLLGIKIHGINEHFCIRLKEILNFKTKITLLSAVLVFANMNTNCKHLHLFQKRIFCEPVAGVQGAAAP